MVFWETDFNWFGWAYPWTWFYGLHR